MFRPHVALVCIALVVSLTPASQSADKATIQKILADRIAAKRNVGIVVGYLDGKRRFVVGEGRVGPNNPKAPDGTTVFEIGSVTKAFTGVLLADMVRRGEVELNAPIARFLPKTTKLPGTQDNPITLYHLTTHTSGLPRMPNNYAPADAANPYADYTVGNMMDFLANHTLAREPGEKGEYSNLGVGLLGHILAEVAKSDYETLVKERIALPLKMQDTSIKLTRGMKRRLAKGHNAELRPVPNWDIPTLAGAGALRSTVNDMLKFLAVNITHDRSKLAGAMQVSHQPREPISAGKVGMGWITSEKHGRKIVWHNGGTGGYKSFAGFDKDAKRGVVVLTNTSTSVDDIGLHLLDPKSKLVDLKPVATVAKVPDSAVGKAFTAWLQAARDGDKATREHYDEAFTSNFQSAVPQSAYLPLQKQLRPALQVAKIEHFVARNEYALAAFVQLGGSWIKINMQVERKAPHKIAGLRLSPGAPPANEGKEKKK